MVDSFVYSFQSTVQYLGVRREGREFCLIPFYVNSHLIALSLKLKPWTVDYLTISPLLIQRLSPFEVIQG